MQAWFQKSIGNDGYSEEGGRVLEGDIEWEEIPDDPEVTAWLKEVIWFEEETKLPPIEGGITTQEFMQEFKKGK